MAYAQGTAALDLEKWQATLKAMSPKERKTAIVAMFDAMDGGPDDTRA